MPIDPVYQARLQRRVRKVIAPIVRRQAENAARQAEERAFAALSPSAQVESLKSHAIAFLTKKRMRRVQLRAGNSNNPYVSWRRVGDLLNIVLMWVLPHATAKDVASINLNNDLLLGLHIFRSDEFPKDITQAKTRLLICCPGSLLDSKFRKNSLHAITREGGILEWRELQSTQRGGPELSNLVQYEAIGKIRSPSQLVEHLSESLSRHDFISQSQ